jgi:hypothetical protein
VLYSLLDQAVTTVRLSAYTELNLLENNALCWAVVWKIFPVVKYLDPDKQVRP